MKRIGGNKKSKVDMVEEISKGKIASTLSVAILRLGKDDIDGAIRQMQLAIVDAKLYEAQRNAKKTVADAER